MKYLILAALFIADISLADGTQEFTVVNVGVVRSAGYETGVRRDFLQSK